MTMSGIKIANALEEDSFAASFYTFGINENERKIT